MVSAMGLIVVVRFVMALSVGGGGVDFYYYSIIARDWLRLLAGEKLDLTWIYYNPGIFRFYHALMIGGVTTPYGLSLAINSLHLLNALLVTIILLRMKVHPLLSIWAGIWALFIIEHFEGFGGCTEPLVLVPMLAGLAMSANPTHPWWQGRTLFYVAAGLALSFYVKQQGMLYVLAALGAIFWAGNWQQLSWLKRAAILAGVAMSIFLLLVAADPGSIIESLAAKVYLMRHYPTRNASLWGSLGGEKAADPKLVYLLLGLTAALVSLRFFPKGKSWLATPMGTLFAFCVFMALTSAFQVSRRQYRHYLLLTWPPLILAFTIGMNIFFQRLSSLKWRLWPKVAALLLVAFPFTGFGGRQADGRQEPWFFPKPTIFPVIGAPLLTWPPPAWLTTFTRLRDDLPPGTTVVVMPPRYNIVFWYLDLQHPLKDYGYQVGDLGYQEKVVLFNIPNVDPVYAKSLLSPKTQAIVFLLDTSEFRDEWVQQAQLAGFTHAKREGPILCLMR
jgi:hypothetical protein